MQVPAIHDVTFYSSAGVLIGDKQPLVAGTTYYAELGGAETMWDSIQWKHDDALVLTAITIESSNLPTEKPDTGYTPTFWGGARVWDAAAGNWHPETAIATYSDAGGGSADTYTTTLTHIGGNGAKRLRAKVVVGATGGKLRGIPHRKAG